MVLVSVLMPIHGKAPYLYNAVQSVIEQDFDSWELILVLDRPSEELIELVSAFKDTRIKIFTSPGSGIVDALNNGLNRAKGRFIARLDSDDIMEKTRLTKQFAFMQSFDDIDCVGSQLTFIDSEGKKLSVSNYPSNFKSIKRTLKYQNCIGHPAVMFRKEAIVNLGGYRKFLTGVEDYDLWLRVSKTGKIVNLEETLTRYRVYPGQYSKTFGEEYTGLEDAARLDLVFTIFPSDSETSSIAFKELVAKIRRKNLFQHPVKVFSSYQGTFVSKMIRIRGRKTSKFVKAVECAPYILGIFLVAPLTAWEIIINVIKVGLKKHD